jgi:hypothetical protein
MSRSAIHLFNPYDVVQNPYNEDKLRIQDVIYYCEARFRAAMVAMSDEEVVDRVKWMRVALGSEVVSGAKCKMIWRFNFPRNLHGLTWELLRLWANRSRS